MSETVEQRFYRLNNVGNERCLSRISRSRVCDTLLTNRVVRGETRPFCSVCDRKHRGICAYCDQPVYGIVGRARVCVLHQKLGRQESCEAWVQRNVKQNRRQKRTAARQRYHENRPRQKLWQQAFPERARENARRNYLAHREKRILAVAERKKREGRKKSVGKRCRTTDCPHIPKGAQRFCGECEALRKESARKQLIALGALVA